jgi:hypothetical protein
MVTYTDSLAGVEPRHLEGFFVGWPSQPSPQRHLAVLEGSSHPCSRVMTTGESSAS